jgi:hypothetical protein
MNTEIVGQGRTYLSVIAVSRLPKKASAPVPANPPKGLWTLSKGGIGAPSSSALLTSRIRREVTGLGHGAPPKLANLYLEGSLQEVYSELTLDQMSLR